MFHLKLTILSPNSVDKAATTIAMTNFPILESRPAHANFPNYKHPNCYSRGKACPNMRD